MFYSFYPSDTDENNALIIKQAIASDTSKFFVSLHMPETPGLMGFLLTLQEMARRYGFTYIADISPLTWKLLDLSHDRVSALKEYGIKGLRLDFGLDYSIIKTLVNQGLEVFINASTVSPESFRKIGQEKVKAFHNFYPRPYTGLSESYFVQQNEYLRNKGIDEIWAFVPGEINKRIPLKMGLPTLEAHRNQNPYTAYVELARKHGMSQIGVAEGVLYDENFNRIARYHKTGVISLPASLCAGAEKLLLGKEFKVRKEHTGYTWRLEQTRGFSIPQGLPIQKFSYSAGDIYMDCTEGERYRGEIHIAVSDKPMDYGMMKIGSIHEDFIELIDLLYNEPTIIFE